MSAGKDAPEPCRSAACAGDAERTNPNASATVAIFAILDDFIISPYE